VNAATYVVQHPELGWLAFGGNLEAEKGLVRVSPLDSFRSRVYIAPLGLWLTLDSGRFQHIEIDPAAHKVRLELAPATKFTTVGRLRVEQPAHPAGVGTFRPSQVLNMERGAYTVPLEPNPVVVQLVPSQN